MIHIALVAAALSILSSPAEAASRMQPVYNVIDKPFNTLSGRSLSLEEAERILVDAITTKGWSVSKVEDGFLKAQIDVRKHFAAIDVRYTPDKYSITYQDSRVLRYDGTRIHRNYNKWILLIEELVDKNTVAR